MFYSGLGGNGQEDLLETKLQLFDNKTDVGDDEQLPIISCYIILPCMLCS